MNKMIWFIPIIVYICISSVVCQDLHLERLHPSCSVLGDILHCFGGGIDEFDITEINESTNSHIVLDLKSYDGFKNLNPSTAIWKSASTTINNGVSSTSLSPLVHGASTSISSDSGFVILGGYTNYINKTNPLEFPFIKYDSDSSQWTALPSPSNYTANVTIVDLKNGQIWAWGINSDNSAPSGILNIFHFNNFTWTQPLTANMPEGRYGHTATLDNKGVIHIIGGFAPSLNVVVPLTNVATFNTNTYQWNTINATIINKKYEGDYGRLHHTVTHIPNTDLLIVYGGMTLSDSQRYTLKNIYNIYDTNNNTFTYIPISNRNIINYRYGHFATIYNNNYLLLSFGNNRYTTNSFTESLTVLNITDPSNPAWVNITDPKIATLETKVGLPAGEIAAIVVGIVLGTSVIIGVFMYLRYRKRKRNKAFVLEQEDPRRISGNHYESQNNSFVIKPFDSGENEKYVSVKPSDSKMGRQSSDLSDSNETNGQTEISDNTNKTLI